MNEVIVNGGKNKHAQQKIARFFFVARFVHLDFVLMDGLIDNMEYNNMCIKFQSDSII